MNKTKRACFMLKASPSSGDRALCEAMGALSLTPDAQATFANVLRPPIVQLIQGLRLQAALEWIRMRVAPFWLDEHAVYDVFHRRVRRDLYRRNDPLRLHTIYRYALREASSPNRNHLPLDAALDVGARRSLEFFLEALEGMKPQVIFRGATEQGKFTHDEYAHLVEVVPGFRHALRRACRNLRSRVERLVGYMRLVRTWEYPRIRQATGQNLNAARIAAFRAQTKLRDLARPWPEGRLPKRLPKRKSAS